MSEANQTAQAAAIAFCLEISRRHLTWRNSKGDTAREDLI